MTVCIVWTHSGHVDLIFIRSTTLLARHIQWDGRGSESATFRNIQRRIDTIVGYTLRRSYFTRKGSRVGIGSKLCQGKHRRGSFSVPPSTEKVSAPVSKERQTIFSLPPLVSSSNPNLVVIPLRGISALAVTVILPSPGEGGISTEAVSSLHPEAPQLKITARRYIRTFFFFILIYI